MKFFKVSAAFVKSFHLQFAAAVQQLQNHDSMGHFDLALEECMSFGPDLVVPPHDCDCHFSTLYVASGGREDEHVHYSFQLSHLIDVLRIMEEDNVENVRVETTVISHWNSVEPVKQQTPGTTTTVISHWNSIEPVKQQTPGTTTIGELLKERCAKKHFECWEAAVVDHLKERRLVNAIKEIREEFGISLKEAWDIIDGFRDMRHSDTPLPATSIHILSSLRAWYGQDVFPQ